MDFADQAQANEEKERGFAVHQSFLRLKGGGTELAGRKRSCENPNNNENCEGTISRKRLKALPDTTLCIKCKEQAEELQN
ncbi:MAG: TraR/DksA C4-type zinc finger protein [Candidatus Yanofskybacteria bacterium]|nr:TraR/DksA C4-type zinc finger protein [Candidatus Yanofskybacteria bacterium]